jgi:hypothetical protein
MQNYDALKTHNVKCFVLSLNPLNDVIGKLKFGEGKFSLNKNKQKF